MVVVLQVTILEDSLREGDERFTVELTAFDISVVLVNSIAEVIIKDDNEGRWLNSQMHNTV